jgi:hypothetical protein
MTLPQFEVGLCTLLGVSYVERDWQPILKVVMNAERDTERALEGLTKIKAAVFDSVSNASRTPSLTSNSTLIQLSDAEHDLQKAVHELKRRNRIMGTPLTLEDMLNPIEEKEIGVSSYKFEGGDNEIVDRVNDYEIAVKKGRLWTSRTVKMMGTMLLISP